MDSPRLGHKTALCWVPPRDKWRAIQEIRCSRDKGFVRWPPHINLLYPFWTDRDENLLDAAKRIRAEIKKIEPFSMTLGELGIFNHGKSCTVWLNPNSQRFIELQSVVQKAFPECYHLNNDPSRRIEAYTPHLSVGQWNTQREAETFIEATQTSFEPIEVPVKELMIIQRPDFYAPFNFRFEIGLGDGADDGLKEIGVPYIASVNTSSALCAEYSYGLGSSVNGQGVWTFAYGTDINPAVIEQLKIRPLESIPAVIKGHKLLFTHRRGRPTIAMMTADERSYYRQKGIEGVHGVLYRLTFNDMSKMCTIKGDYRPDELQIETPGGAKFASIVFVSPDVYQIRDDLPPPSTYTNLIIEGAEFWRLESNYIEWLKSIDTVSTDIKDLTAAYSTNLEGKKPSEPVPRVTSSRHKRRQ